MALAGWYADPHGDHDQRYWDGQRWTEHVASFGLALVDPSEDVGLPDQEQRLWGHGAHVLTTHRIWIDDGPPSRRGHPEPLPLWTVQDVEPRKKLGQDLSATGDIALRVAYPGYVGPTHRVLKAVPQVGVTAAWIRRWARRNRRVYGAG